MKNNKRIVHFLKDTIAYSFSVSEVKLKRSWGSDGLITDGNLFDYKKAK